MFKICPFRFPIDHAPVPSTTIEISNKNIEPDFVAVLGAAGRIHLHDLLGPNIMFHILDYKPNHSIVLTDKTYVVKVSYSIKRNTFENAKNEIRVYEKMSQNSLYLAPYHGMYIASDMCFLVTKFMGEDAFDQINRNAVTDKTFDSLVRFLPSCVQDFHVTYKRMHGDIKLENLIYNEKEQRWYIVDLGFSRSLAYNDGPYMYGTFPYHVPTDTLNSYTLRDSKIISDIYATALTILFYAKIFYVHHYCYFCVCKEYHCDHNQQIFTRIPIEKIYEKRNGESTAVRLCCDIVLSQVDNEAKYLLWNVTNGKSIYVGKNSRYDPSITRGDIFELWKKLIIC